MPKRTLRDLAAGAALALALVACGRKVDEKTREGYDLVVAGKIEEATALANAVLADDPKNTGALNVLGLARYKSRDLKGAAEYFEKALEIDPRHPEVHFNLGNVYQAMKRLQEAEVQFSAAVEAQDKFVLARYNLGKIYEETGRTDQALAQYRRCVDLDPQFIFGYMDAGRILEESGDFEGAITNYKRAIELQPAVKELRVHLGNSYFQSGRPDGIEKAEGEYRAAIGIDENYVDALYSLGVLMAGAQRHEEGATWFRRALLASGPGADTDITRQIRKYFAATGIPEEGPTTYTPPDSAAAAPAAPSPS
jgi:tetratricopeptide (TPR) repeat protein